MTPITIIKWLSFIWRSVVVLQHKWGVPTLPYNATNSRLQRTNSASRADLSGRRIRNTEVKKGDDDDDEEMKISSWAEIKIPIKDRYPLARGQKETTFLKKKRSPDLHHHFFSKNPVKVESYKREQQHPTSIIIIIYKNPRPPPPSVTPQNT